MELPVSFDEVSYFNNEYRGDLIITKGVLYYFPHTRVAFARHAKEIGGKEQADFVGVLGLAVPFFGMVPWIHTAADKTVKVGKLLRRTFLPSTNSPRIRHQHLWSGAESCAELQKQLDEYIARIKREPPTFDDDSVPKPLRFTVDEIENARLGIKFTFDAKFDNHDFRVNPIIRNSLKRALLQGGFLK